MTEPRVLLVDDEPQLLAGLKAALWRQPYRLLIATSAEEAEAVLAQHHVQVVVSDHDMPDMTGLEFLKRVAERSPTTARIMLTGHARVDLAIQAINGGNVFRFFVKPFDAKELAAAIREALAWSKAQATARGEEVDDPPTPTTTRTGAIELRPPAEDLDTLVRESAGWRPRQ
jgi:DNA-binding NtrC family response regulator